MPVRRTLGVSQQPGQSAANPTAWEIVCETGSTPVARAGGQGGSETVKRWLKRIFAGVVALAVLGGVGLLFVPEPVAADLASVSRGPLQVTIEEDGKTRIKQRYVVSAPLAGRLLRVELKAGDPVVAAQTVLAAIEPTDPALLDPRALAQTELRVKAAESAVRQAASNAQRAKAALDFSETEHARVRQLFARKVKTREDLEESEMRDRMRAEEFKAARIAEEIAQFELEVAKAALIRTRPLQESQDREKWQVDVRAPISGKVLKVLQESSAVLNPGMPILEVGNPQDLEVEIDILSSDAVKVSPGDRVLFEQWGGERPLEGRVRLVEPAAFTKISALGVEEQRVNVIADFTDPLEQRKPLGDAYRVEARIVIWEQADVLQLPTSALFRHGPDWAVYVVRGGVARLQPIQVGRRTGLATQVVTGLQAGDVVIQHHSDKVHDGVRIKPRVGSALETVPASAPAHQ